MADPKKPAPAGKKVAVLDPSGAFGFIDESDVPNLPSSARVLTQKQLVQRQVDEAYDKQTTAQKVVGSLAGPTASQLANPTATAITGKAPDVAIAAHPAVESFSQGALEPLTLGTERIAMKQATKALAGEQAAKDYVQHGEDVTTAYSGANTAGQVAGFATGAMIGGASGLGISALGGGAEALAARGVGSVVGKGVLGRALTSAAGLGARGAVEGGLYAGAHEAVEENLQDHELAADKIWAATGTGMIYGGAGGAALGGAGSLAKSAVKGTAGALGRVMAKGETAALRAEEAAVEGEAAALSKPQGRNIVSDLRGGVEGQKGLAYDEAWKAIGGGGTLAPTRPVKIAMRVLPNGTRDLGEIAMRHSIIDATGSIGSAFANGKASSMIEKGALAEANAGQKIGALTDASGARITGQEILDEINKVAKPYESIAGQEHIGTSIREYGLLLGNQLKLNAAGDSASVQSVLAQRKGLDQLAYKESRALDPKMRVEALRDLRGGIEELIATKIDQAAEGLPGAKRAEYELLKKDFFGLKLINEVLEDTAARQAKAATFGVSSIAAGAAAVASGNFMAAPAMAIGTKLVKERGNAALAVALYRAAERGHLNKMVEQFDNLLGRASKGLLQAPKPGLLPASIATPSTKPQAAALAAMKMVAQYQSDPEKMADNVTRNTESMASHSPEIAAAVAQRAVAAHAFLSEKMPPGADPDPLDPHPAPHLTNSEAATFSRYAWYADKPERFFLEAAHGKLTPEGAETAQRLMPSAFAELQTRTADALATQLAKGTTIPFQQRLLLGQLLNFAAVPSQRPDHMQMLQKNVTVDPPQPAPAPKPLKTGSISTQRSSYDRLEASGPGRR